MIGAPIVRPFGVPLTRSVFADLFEAEFDGGAVLERAGASSSKSGKPAKTGSALSSSLQSAPASPPSFSKKNAQRWAIIGSGRNIFLHLTWAPVPGNQLFQRRSEFWDDILASKWVKRRAPDYSGRTRLPPTPRAGVTNVVTSFSDLKYFFGCPYQFKLRILYGFNAPIDEALGYGKSLHDALCEVHARAIRGDIADDREGSATRRTTFTHALCISRTPTAT